VTAPRLFKIEASGVSSSCFLNVPYDKNFERLFLAYVAGISALGLTPRATLEIPGGVRRLDRILQLIESCRYSIHDLSRVQLDRKPPTTPRFNMPFEAALAVALERMNTSSKRVWFVFEAVPRRLEKSLSDLAGTDVYIHHATTNGLYRQLNNAFERTGVSVQQMKAIYRDLRRNLPIILQETGAISVYEASAFRRLVVLSKMSARKHLVS
jgi:hypothetical protein